MTAADQFYVVAIALMAAVVLVMVALACAFRVVWLVAEARSSQRMVTDDLDVTEYADHADEYSGAVVIDWSTEVWAEIDRGRA